MASILDHPDAVALLQQATLSPQHVADCAAHLHAFLQRYAHCFQRAEQRHNAMVVLQGQLSALPRKTSEPIARQAGLQRKPIQAFVGWAPWDDEAVMTELRQDVRDCWADPNAAFIIDSSGFVKKGDASCGVTRQGCGRAGKVENCQVGVFLAYSCRHGHVGIDRRLFLPRDWADDPVRRNACHVPTGITYQEHWQIALDLIDRCRGLPHAWVTADSEFGRVVDFRDALSVRGQRYVLDVRKGRPPERLTVIRTVEARPRTWYTLSNAAVDVPVTSVARAHAARHRGKEVFEEGKSEVGLGQYEVRRWDGWHHPMTLSLLALWFVSRERGRAGEEKGDPQRPPDAGDLQPSPVSAGAERGADSRGDNPCVAA